MSSGPAALGGKHQDGEGGRPPTSTQLPTQMQLLGAFVEALRLRQNLPRNPKCSLDDTTSDRGFTGATETTEHWCCRLTTMCQALVEHGLVPLGEGAPLDGAPHLGLFVVFAPKLALWRDVRAQASHVTPLAFARHAAVTASMRVAPLLSVLDEEVPEDSLAHQVELLAEDPAWADPKRVGEGLRRVIEATAGTQRKFAEAVVCSQDALSKWMKGKGHPTYARFEDMEAALMEEYSRSPAEARAVVVRLRWSFALAQLTKRLRGQLGHEATRELATVFARLTRCHREALQQAGALKTPSEALSMSMAVLSCYGEPIDGLLAHAARHGASEGFVRDVATAHAAWRGVIAERLGQLGVGDHDDDRVEHHLLELLPRVKGAPPQFPLPAARP